MRNGAGLDRRRALIAGFLHRLHQRRGEGEIGEQRNLGGGGGRLGMGRRILGMRSHWAGFLSANVTKPKERTRESTRRNAGERARGAPLEYYDGDGSLSQDGRPN